MQNNSPSYRSWLQGIVNSGQTANLAGTNTTLSPTQASGLLQVVGDDFQLNNDFLSNPYAYAGNDRGQVFSTNNPSGQNWGLGPESAKALNQGAQRIYESLYGGQKLGYSTDTPSGQNNTLIKQGLNTGIANLQGQLDTLNPQENVAKANVLNQFTTNKNRLDVGYNTGLGNLSTARNQVNASKERSLKNLRDSIMMQSQGYANQLGSFGAGDSSAAGMINYALGQQGARERGNLMEEAGTQLTGIQRQEEELGRQYQNQTQDLENWKNTTLSDIVMKYQTLRNQINNSIVDARARAAAEQNLVSQAVSELQNLENNYRSQAEQMSQLFQNALAPQNIGIDPSLQQYAVQALSPTQLEQLRMPQAVNPESELTALLRRRDEERSPILGY